MTKLDKLHQRWLKDPSYRKAYESLEEEFSVEHARIELLALRKAHPVDDLAELLQDSKPQGTERKD